MDAMACSISRSGHFMPELTFARYIFPDREYWELFWDVLVANFPIRNCKGYGVQVADRHFPPDALFRRLRPFDRLDREMVGVWGYRRFLSLGG